MPDLDDIIAKLSVGEIAKRLGVDEKTARAAIDTAVPAIAGGLKENSKSKGGAESLAKALDKHAARDDDTLDEQDGEKIVGHVFGDQKQAVAARLGSAPGPAGGDLFAKLLPMIAPMVMSQVAKKIGPKSATVPQQGGGGLVDAIGSLVQGSGKSKGVQDLLGDLLGGGRR